MGVFKIFTYSGVYDCTSPQKVYTKISLSDGLCKDNTDSSDTLTYMCSLLQYLLFIFCDLLDFGVGAMLFIFITLVCVCCTFWYH